MFSWSTGGKILSNNTQPLRKQICFTIVWGYAEVGEISAQLLTIVKQICFPNGNVLFLSLTSVAKNWMHNLWWGYAEILPRLIKSAHNWPPDITGIRHIAKTCLRNG